jgi:hypothetical protein
VSIAVRPATAARFADVATMLGPRNPDSSVCWCLSHRLDWKTNQELRGFTKAADTTSVAGGFPRVLMRLDLR